MVMAKSERDTMVSINETPASRRCVVGFLVLLIGLT
jgi:hypothetical protein